MDIRELKQELGSRALSLCSTLFPDGRVEGQEFKVGSVSGEPGRSLSVYLSGERAGNWTDFATGEGGDMIDLIMQAHRMDIKDAMEWGRRECNIREKHHAKIRSPQPKEHRAAQLPTPHENNEVLEKVMLERGFQNCESIIERHKIYACTFKAGFHVVFPYYSPEGKLELVKNKPLDHEGNPGTCGQSNLKPILFGWQTMPPASRQVWITEGEWDAIACTEIGFPALSVPMGGGKGAKQTKWIANEYENLARFDEIIIATDMDEQGELAAKEIAQRLGDRCIRIKIPAKDINELLQKVGMEQAKFALQKCYEDAKWQDPETLRSVAEFADDVADYFTDKEGDVSGFGMGWEKTDSLGYRFRPSELIGCVGFSGSRKTMFLGQVSLNAIEQGQKVLVASMEMSPKMLLGRMFQQACAVANPTPEYQTKVMEWMAQNFWLFIDDLNPKVGDLLKCFEYAYRRYGVNVFIIDSMTCMCSHEDYRKQQEIVEQIVQFKNALNCTVFLVTHSRKQEDESRAPGKMDVKGTGAITDLADSFFSIWINKKKAEHMRYCQITDEEPDEKIASQWDVQVNVLKNRNGQFEGSIGFDFDPVTLQFLEQKRGKSRKYIQWSKA
jgi:twinkle protein